MALFTGSIRSAALQMDTLLQVFMPAEDSLAPAGTEMKTVILLHGLKQNAESWTRMSRVVRFAAMTGFNVIVPEVQRSWYTNMAQGLAYFDYVTRELPEICGKMFRVPMDGGHLYAAGLSMGGYGALKCALTYPDRFAGAMSYSGAPLCMEELDSVQSIVSRGEITAILGPDARCAPDNSLTDLLDTAAAAGRRPRLYVACGTEDPLLDQNRRFCVMARERAFPLIREEWAGGHTWAFWDRACGRSFAFMAGMDPDKVLEEA